MFFLIVLGNNTHRSKTSDRENSKKRENKWVNGLRKTEQKSKSGSGREESWKTVRINSQGRQPPAKTELTGST